MESLDVGPAEDPGTSIGPVIDDDALQRMQDYIEIGKDECRTVVARDCGELAKEGFYVGPHVFADVDPESRLAQAGNLRPGARRDQGAAISTRRSTIANGTDYALTGGIFSRSPRNLARVRQEFQVGNLYLNRGITGALVDRQPFGGYRMSGIGSKAGGRDYLLQFLIPLTVSENTLRRGFAPPPSDA